jgi:hypothetical protein
VTCYIQPCKPCEVTYILHYPPQGEESSPRGSWGICVPASPEVLTHIMLKEEWSEHTFIKLDCTAFETAFKRLSKHRQTAVSKSCHNLWHTGTRNGQIYRGRKSCCFCNTEEEYWNHVLSCGSLYATMARESSWAKVKKVMAPWKMPLINYSHSRNPPCAPAWMHGRIQVPIEPPN